MDLVLGKEAAEFPDGVAAQRRHRHHVLVLSDAVFDRNSVRLGVLFVELNRLCG